MKEKDLASFINEKRETVRSFRFGTGGRDVRSVRIAKKEIARALTELRERSKEEDKAADAA